MKVKIFKYKKILFLSILLGCLLLIPIQYTNEHFNNIFDNIYKNKSWGEGSIEGGSSGSGSSPEVNKSYISFLSSFIKENNIKSIVDVGCGDWQIMSLLNTDNIHYKGYDVSKKIIDYNNKIHKKTNIEFYVEDLDKKSNYERGDLLICKDVLQHLSYSKINNILSQLNKYKYVIIINDIVQDTNNSDIDNGGYRSLDIQKQPFNIKNIEAEHHLWKSEPTKTLYVIQS